MELGGKIRSYGSHNPLDGNFLHRKMCIVDEAIVMNGAFNWTKNASRNKEDYSINNDPSDAEACIEEFFKLWDVSQELNWEYIQNYATNSIKELEDLEDKGISPLDIIQDKTTANINIKSLNSTILNEAQMEIDKQNNELVTTTDFFSANSNNLIYEKDLVLWGVEPGTLTNWYKLKFKVDEKIINIAVDKVEFLELLKTETDYFDYWLRNKGIPLSTLSNPKGRIKLSGPIHFLKLTNEQDRKKYDRCKFKIVVEVDDVVCIEVSRISHHYTLDDLSHIVDKGPIIY